MQTIEGLTVISRLCMLIKRTLDVHGCDGEALLRQAGIDYDSVNSIDTRISATEFQALWRVAVAATGDPCF